MVFSALLSFEFCLKRGELSIPGRRRVPPPWKLITAKSVIIELPAREKVQRIGPEGPIRLFPLTSVVMAGAAPSLVPMAVAGATALPLVAVVTEGGSVLQSPRKVALHDLLCGKLWNADER